MIDEDLPEYESPEKPELLAPSLRFVVTMESGRKLVIYARDKAAACARIVKARDEGETVRDTFGARMILVRELGGIQNVVQESRPAAMLVQDGRKAPGS